MLIGQDHEIERDGACWSVYGRTSGIALTGHLARLIAAIRTTRSSRQAVEDSYWRAPPLERFTGLLLGLGRRTEADIQLACALATIRGELVLTALRDTLRRPRQQFAATYGSSAFDNACGSPSQNPWAGAARVEDARVYERFTRRSKSERAMRTRRPMRNAGSFRSSIHYLDSRIIRTGPTLSVAWQGAFPFAVRIIRFEEGDEPAAIRAGSADRWAWIRQANASLAPGVSRRSITTTQRSSPARRLRSMRALLGCTRGDH